MGLLHLPQRVHVALLGRLLCVFDGSPAPHSDFFMALGILYVLFLFICSEAVLPVVLFLVVVK